MTEVIIRPTRFLIERYYANQRGRVATRGTKKHRMNYSFLCFSCLLWLIPFQLHPTCFAAGKAAGYGDHGLADSRIPIAVPSSVKDRQGFFDGASGARILWTHKFGGVDKSAGLRAGASCLHHYHHRLSDSIGTSAASKVAVARAAPAFGDMGSGWRAS